MLVLKHFFSALAVLQCSYSDSMCLIIHTLYKLLYIKTWLFYLDLIYDSAYPICTKFNYILFILFVVISTKTLPSFRFIIFNESTYQYMHT
jgi:hypothetical protein